MAFRLELQPNLYEKYHHLAVRSTSLKTEEKVVGKSIMGVMALAH